ncbi:uncharacterized protein LOC131228027 [Magnolia sinica]|uniref:uncharacterized protein LOC131228027 n=1 Tax=Magnolia sinica TaxID=86752 RepID=UPI00265B714E|nr:uncharacterized protein LOC131228027 [Magnolia sinica]
MWRKVVSILPTQRERGGRAVQEGLGIPLSLSKMESPPSSLAYAPLVHDGVDPFLMEALQNPRHRLTVLRMELDIQRFMQNPDQHQFEFPHFPTSYLRLAAHRVAQHYCLQSTVADNGIDSSGSGIIVRKTGESRSPAVALKDIPLKQPEGDKLEKIKIAIRPRQSNASPNDSTEVGIKRSSARTVEERKEQYDRARARIFSSPSSPDVEDMSSPAASDGRSFCLTREDSVGYRNATEEPEKISTKDSTSRVAIFRDREKDRSDPDYDRSYDRYARSLTHNQNFSSGPFTMLHPPFVQYKTGYPQLGQLPGTQASMNYRPSNTVMNPFCTVGSNQPPRDPVYLHWPSPAMMYAQSCEHFRQAVFQAPFYQQPLSFDYSQHR